MTITTGLESHLRSLAGRALARNVVVTFMGYAVSGVAAFAVTPRIVHGLGVERYGLLALILSVVGYLRQDFGLASGTTRVVASALGAGDDASVPRILWTSIAASFVLAAFSVLLLVGAMPLLVGRWLNIPAALKPEAFRVLMVTTAAIGIPVLIEPLKGVLAAYQRFPAMNALKVSSSLSTSVIFLAGITLRADLATMVGGIAIKDCAFWLLHLRIVARLVKGAGGRRPDWRAARQVFGFGAWLTIYQIARMSVQYVELPVIGSVLTLAAVGYYAAAGQLVGMLAVLPGAIAEVFFPAYCALHIAESARLRVLFRQVLKYETAFLGFIAVILFVFAEEILTLWLGPSFLASANVLRILAIGFCLGGVASAFSAVLHGTGHIKKATRGFVAAAPFQLVAVYVLTRWVGLIGPAIAAVLFQALLVLLYGAMCVRWTPVDATTLIWGRWPRVVAVIAVAAAVIIALKSAYAVPLAGSMALGVGLIVLYALVAWHWIISGEDKMTLCDWTAEILRRPAFGAAAR